MARTDQDTALPQASSKQPSRPPSGSRGIVFAWAGVLSAGAAVAALAVATITADDDVDIRSRRLAAQAEKYEREAHLEGQANTYGRDTGATNPSETGNRAAQRAEEYQREAHLEGQANTYGRNRGTTTLDNDPPATDGTAEDARALDPPPECLWTTEVNTPVFPAEDLGAAPTPESVLTFESCNGEWTGRIAWLNPG
jgi:hypothetical protein